MDEAECNRYQKAAEKQREMYQIYMKNKRNVDPTQIKAKKRNAKEARKVAEQLSRSTISQK